MPVSSADRLPALLPLLLAEIPPHVSQLLQVAGVPTRNLLQYELGSLNGLTESERAGCAVVLFDSRGSGSRRLAEAAREAGIKTVNVAAILSGWPVRPAARMVGRGRYLERLLNSRLLLRLKFAVEQAGGMWLRVGDYPYPYRSVLCTGNETVCDAVLPAALLEADAKEPAAPTAREQNYQAWLLRRYRSGLPVCTGWKEPGSLEGLEGECSSGSGLPRLPGDSTKCPLLWVASSSSYQAWREIRRQLKISVSLHEGSWDIRCRGWSVEAMPSLELWRGNHVASFPLRWPVQRVQESDLIFVRDEERHPAGIAARELRPALDTISRARYQRPAA